MRKPLVRHVSAIQVQMRQPAQRGDRLQARVADACGCGRWRHSVSAGVRRVAGGLNSVQPLQSGGAGAAVAAQGAKIKGTASSCLYARQCTGNGKTTRAALLQHASLLVRCCGVPADGEERTGVGQVQRGEACEARQRRQAPVPHC